MKSKHGGDGRKSSGPKEGQAKDTKKRVRNPKEM